jgi:K+-transporting ATPase KdpF subunit
VRDEVRIEVRNDISDEVTDDVRIEVRNDISDEVRDQVGIDYTIGLLVSVLMLGYLILAMLRPEKF